MRDHPAYAGRPDRVKVAVDGVWEAATTIALENGEAGGAGELAGEAGELAGVVLDAATDVACEAFFGEAFFGVRQRGTPEQMAAFAQAFVVAAAHARSGPELFDDIAAALDIDVAAEFRFCELGAEGAWRSVGPLRIENPNAAVADPDALWARITAASVGNDTQHAKALEFTYANPDGATTHWFALPVSRGARIDRAALEAALAAGA